jgi:hypothetical protein
MTQSNRFDAGASKKSLHPGINRNFEIDQTAVNEQRNFPGCDTAGVDHSSAPPALVD